jgi:hypothetical protein
MAGRSAILLPVRPSLAIRALTPWRNSYIAPGQAGIAAVCANDDDVAFEAGGGE